MHLSRPDSMGALCHRSSPPFPQGATGRNLSQLLTRDTSAVSRLQQSLAWALTARTTISGPEEAREPLLLNRRALESRSLLLSSLNHLALSFSRWQCCSLSDPQFLATCIRLMIASFGFHEPLSSLLLHIASDLLIIITQVSGLPSINPRIPRRSRSKLSTSVSIRPTLAFCPPCSPFSNWISYNDYAARPTSITLSHTSSSFSHSHFRFVPHAFLSISITIHDQSPPPPPTISP